MIAARYRILSSDEVLQSSMTRYRNLLFDSKGTRAVRPGFVNPYFRLTIWEQLLPDTVQNRHPRHWQRLDNTTTSLFLLYKQRIADSIPATSAIFLGSKPSQFDHSGIFAALLFFIAASLTAVRFKFQRWG